jgi:hypothetical protein
MSYESYLLSPQLQYISLPKKTKTLKTHGQFHPGQIAPTHLQTLSQTLALPKMTIRPSNSLSRGQIQLSAPGSLLLADVPSVHPPLNPDDVVQKILMMIIARQVDRNLDEELLNQSIALHLV